MKRFPELLIVAFAVTSFGAHAADGDSPWRVGIAGTFTEYSFDDKSIDDNAVGVRVIAEYRINEYLGLGATFLNTGKVKDRTPAGRASITLEGFTAGVLGYVPLPGDEIELFGKVGYFSLDQDLRVADTFQSRRTNGLTLGAGGRVSMTDRIGVRLELDWFDTKNSDFKLVSVGVDYQF